MTELLSTRVQRNWGTDHVYLTNAKMANVWYCITGKKTVSDIDISNLPVLIRTVRNELIDSQLNIEQSHINSDNHARAELVEKCYGCTDPTAHDIGGSNND